MALFYNNTVQIFDTTNTNLPTQKFYSFHRDSDGRKWIGSIDKGLIRWDDDSTYVMYNSGNTGITSNFINGIAEDSEGTIWFANDDGFASLSNSVVTVHPELHEDWSIVAIEVDENDNIWIGTAWYGLYLYNKSGFSLITSTKENNLTPLEYILAQNHPNPFNPTTRINYQIPQQGFVTLKIFDVLGKEIARLINEEKPAGKYEVDFSVTGLASGVYIYRMKVNEFIESKKMILVR